MDIETAAQVMGMKPYREVREVVPVDGGHKALTHDGQWTFIGAGEPPVLAPTGPPERAPEPAPAPEQPVVVGVGEGDDGDDDLSEVEDDLDDGDGDFDGDSVPEGTKDDVLAWVGDDVERAAAALDAERAREHPRSTLITALEKVGG